MNDAPQPTPQADVLIVDDTPANLQVLAGMLRDCGFKVRLVPSGKLALRAAQTSLPDLILLDIMMPDMDGYEVCRLMKQMPELSQIPVIFISALNDTAEKVKALATGGVDYITKPFQFEGVQARVETHLRLRRYQLELAAQHRHLQESYDRLRELEGLRDSLTQMIVHDLRTPLTSLLTGLQTLEAVAELDETGLEMLQVALQGGGMLLSMINDLLDIGKMEDGSLQLDPSEVDVSALVERCLQQVKHLAQDKGLQLGATIGDGVPPLLADEEKLRRALVNLLGNAIKFTSEGAVALCVAPDEAANAVRFCVTDTGEGIPQEAFDRIFEKFGQVESRKAGRKMSTGLGLTFCKMVVEAHGGRIWVESELGKGSAFRLTVPLTPQ